MYIRKIRKLQKRRQYCPFLIWLMLLGMFTNSLMRFLWSFIGKYVIDIVETQAGSPDKDIMPLLHLLLVTTAIELVSMTLNTITDNKRWYRFIDVRMNMITEANAKALSMNYQSLERPKMLDMFSKAKEATGGNNNGVEGMMHSIYDFCVQVVTLTVTLTAVVVLDWRLLLIIAVISFAQFLFFRYTVKKDKRDVWDKLAPTWRKINYMERTTQDFDYAKDIRLFGMKNWLSGKQHEILEEKHGRMVRSRNLWIYNTVFSNSLGIISSAAVYGMLIFFVIGSDMSIGDFTLYLGLTQTFSGTLTDFLNLMGQFKERSMQTDDYRSFMDLAEEKTENTLKIPKTDKYTFEFRNVSYKYEGTDIRRFDRTEYYRLFSPVFQNVEIFAFPMSENISMNTPENTDRAFAEKCAVRAGLGEKLESLTNGINTELLKVLHDDGIDLSGGEKQKLALARALYKNAPVIVLDEPTAALDALAEYELYKNFNEIIGGSAIRFDNYAAADN